MESIDHKIRPTETRNFFHSNNNSFKGAIVRSFHLCAKIKTIVRVEIFLLKNSHIDRKSNVCLAVFDNVIEEDLLATDAFIYAFRGMCAMN